MIMLSMTENDLGYLIIDEFDKITNTSSILNRDRYSERALSILLNIHREDISNLLSSLIYSHRNYYSDIDLGEYICGSFCKSFRQIDVIEDDTQGKTNMLFWNLINNSAYIGIIIKSCCEYFNKVNSGSYSKYLLEDLIDKYMWK